MKRSDYRKGLSVKQREMPPDFCKTRNRKTGVTVSDQLVARRGVDKDDYAEVLWDGSSKAEFVHYNSIEVVKTEEVA